MARVAAGWAGCRSLAPRSTDGPWSVVSSKGPSGPAVQSRDYAPDFAPARAWERGAATLPSAMSDDAAMAAMGLPTGFRDRSIEAEEALPDALHTIAISQEQAGAKLAKHIATVLDGWSRNAAAAAVKEGHIRVNGEQSGANRVLESGDSVTVHAAPPVASAESAERAAGKAAEEPCTLSACQINSLVDERVRAKACANYALADKLFAQLRAASVRLDDRTKTWSTPVNADGSPGLSGTQTALSPEELLALEAERRRVKEEQAAATKPPPPALAPALALALLALSLALAPTLALTLAVALTLARPRPPPGRETPQRRPRSRRSGAA